MAVSKLMSGPPLVGYRAATVVRGAGEVSGHFVDYPLWIFGVHMIPFYRESRLRGVQRLFQVIGKGGVRLGNVMGAVERREALPLPHGLSSGMGPWPLHAGQPGDREEEGGTVLAAAHSEPQGGSGARL